MTGIVLSGGESSRMGREKAFLELDGKPMIEHVIRALRSIADAIIIVTRSPGLYRGFDAAVVTDVFDARGPLTGIYSGLASSHDEYNIVVACDMPFLNPRLLSYMNGLAPGYDVVAPCLEGNLEPLHAVYRKSLLPLLEKRIQRNERQIQGMYRDIRVRRVTEKEVDQFDPARRSFININTPKEYKEASCSDSECRS